MNRRFWIGYAAAFSLIWIVYGLYSVIRGTQSSGTVLAFSIAFAVVFCGSTWLSSWLLSHYRKLDSQRNAMLNQRKN